ncbi:hypothetical protein ACA910_000157 [Epithemia clementina (nom. ined.)]
MNTKEQQTSGEVNPPAPISATPSIDNLQSSNNSLTIGMTVNSKSGHDAARAAVASSLQEVQQGYDLSSEPSVKGAITPTSHGSIISPTAGPAAVPGGASSSSTSGQLGIPAFLLPPQRQSQISNETQSITGSGSVFSGLVASSQAPEFLYQLTKMLTDDNRDTIEWCNGKIEVHSPHRLESDVLQKYFRHSKFASFQRQLNYFGFRKQAGKGKMAPCSYVNEELPSNDLSCLLHIKRKTSVSTAAKEKEKNLKRRPSQQEQSQPSHGVNPVLAGILQRSSMVQTAPTASPAQEFANSENQKSTTMTAYATTSHQAVAQAAVGRGIRHTVGRGIASARPVGNISAATAHVPTPLRYSASVSSSISAETAAQAAQKISTGAVANPLSQLASNFRNSMNDLAGDQSQEVNPTSSDLYDQMSFHGGFLRRDDSLVDLAMIPFIDTNENAGEFFQDGKEHDGSTDDVGLNFIDFPNPDVFPPDRKPG